MLQNESTKALFRPTTSHFALKAEDMILIGFGSNSPFCGLPRDAVVVAAIRSLDEFLNVAAVSSAFESPAWPDPRLPAFINRAAIVETNLSPDALLDRLQAVERAFGRPDPAERPRYGSRSLDLDILAYRDRVEESAADENRLVLPHPRLCDRDFALAPIAEIAPGWRHPVANLTAQELLNRLPRRSASRVAADPASSGE